MNENEKIQRAYPFKRHRKNPDECEVINPVYFNWNQRECQNRFIEQKEDMGPHEQR